MKPFRTIEEQIEILSSRNMKITDVDKQSIKEVLKRENYYSVVNGYKDLFLSEQSNKSSGVEEKYKEGTTFWEIYSLYEVDKALQIDLLELILSYESSLKTKSAYYFGEKYKDNPHAYLDYNSYNNNRNSLKTISSISNIISRDANKGHFKHYLNNYQFIPIWVVITSFTFGNLQYFYEALPDEIQNKIANDYSKTFKKDYGIDVLIQPNILLKANHILNFYRNVCAHGERLYNFKVYKFNKCEKSFSKTFYKCRQEYYKNDGSLFNAIAYLQLLTPKKTFICFLKKFEGHLNKLAETINTIEIEELYKAMGFTNEQLDDGLKRLKEVM